MLKKPSLLGKEAGRYLLIASMTGLLVGCGGSSGGDTEIDEETGGVTPISEQDLDGDGIPNGLDDDSDDDGLDDFNGADNFVDWDEDGFDDITFLTEAEANAGTVVEVTAKTPCGGERGTDNDSSTAGWEDNCVVKRATIGGQFARSLFSVGIQRVLYCSGFEADTDFPDYTGFADGIFGANSEKATIAFQQAEPALTVDGIVGRQTWARLRERVELLVEGDFTGTPDTYGFTTGVCADIPLFYQAISPAADNLDIVGGGWTLARNQFDEAEEIPFSYEDGLDRL